MAQTLNKMDQLAVMRRANGRLFTLTLKGREHLALWPNLKSAIRYKALNPELLVFLPASAASAFEQKSLLPLQKENMGLFLLIDAGDAHFRDGRKISWEELKNSLPATPNFKDAHAAGKMPAIDRFNDDGGNQFL